MAAIAGGYALMELAGITCPIKWLTGCSCAGCGLSRAWISALSLDFPRAIAFHPLFWMPALMVAVWLLKGRIPNSLYRGVLLVGAGSMLAVYFCRLLDSGDTIVVWRPWEGMLFRTVNILGQCYRMLKSIV